jgi:AraC-like DNA-binding protein
LRDLSDDVSIATAAGGVGALPARVRSFAFREEDDSRLEVWSVDLGGAVVATVRASAYDLVAEEDMRSTFLAPLRGMVEVSLGTGRFSFAAGESALIRPGLRRTRLRHEAGCPFLGIGVAVPRPARPTRPRGETPGAAFGRGAEFPAERALRYYLLYLVGQLGRVDSPLLRGAARRSAGALILDLMFELDGFDVEPPPAEVTAAERRVAAAEEFMRAHAEAPLTVEQIAAAVGVGPRALQLAFRQLRGASPRAVLAGIRLDLARARLAAPDAAASVTDIALLCGLTHFGRFAAAYRARFGESPSETLRRARA